MLMNAQEFHPTTACSTAWEYEDKEDKKEEVEEEEKAK